MTNPRNKTPPKKNGDQCSPKIINLLISNEHYNEFINNFSNHGGKLPAKKRQWGVTDSPLICSSSDNVLCFARFQ
jgi:hypothetical protein